MRLARDLQSSGSDIVVEEDLAEMLGRARIVDNVVSSFRAEMAKPDPSITLASGIFLSRGPGPTVTRALTEPAYLSTIILCSFFVSIHEKSSLAATITHYLETLAEETPANAAKRMVPSLDSVRGTLRACENQTAAYQWHWRMQLLSAAAALGYDESEMQSTIPPVVFQGLMALLPLVQTLPEDRTVMIETGQGTCAIVVWAHLLLGLRVATRFYDRSRNKFVEIRFPSRGDLADQVFIYSNITHQNWTNKELQGVQVKPSITLFSASTKEQLIQLNVDLRMDMIHSNIRVPAMGLGQHYLDTVTMHHTGREKVMEEIRCIACSFALCMSRKMFEEPVGYGIFANANNPEYPIQTPTSKILDSACMLFGLNNHQLSSEKCEQYASLYSEAKLVDIPDAPASIRPILQEWNGLRVGSFVSLNNKWPYFNHIATELSILILAFAKVLDLEACAELPLSPRMTLISGSEIKERLSTWDGKVSFMIDQSSWFEVIALLLLGERGERVDVRTTALVSESGWSLFVSSMGDSDPAFVDASSIVIKRGTPWRNGICKQRIIDGPQSVLNYAGWTQCGTFPSTATLECATPMEFGRPKIGELNDNFVIQLLLQTTGEGKTIRWTGYRNLWSSLWTIRKTSPCHHPNRLGATLELQPGWITVTGRCSALDNANYTLVIFMTAGSPQSRWNAIHDVAPGAYQAGYEIFLRSLDSCFSCAAEEASRQPSTSYLLL
ncbi:uncharacterized protein K460DRAFT_101189 [Cucurbitaria berberidis CBS 394.84]|uniref:Uncharacterized protein n=1 Tax=Cucurbitaria berberidis CBS 394.84 TaxID=1168544 RepID=A0A9P4GGT0_9PLEO|nr:uncharacterized protein K460DRAFT_101189 [Cucurbitaria berberidis CBS 394.84]KAF1844959.1 hypothetical protein K460DRAFT_101189 [Cucurbitaria berberidis CBS 394.84]